MYFLENRHSIYLNEIFQNYIIIKLLLFRSQKSLIKLFKIQVDYHLTLFFLPKKAADELNLEFTRSLSPNAFFCSLLRQYSSSHEEAIAFTCCFTAFIDGPDNQALAAANISCRKNTFNICRVFSIFRFHS